MSSKFLLAFLSFFCIAVPAFAGDQASNPPSRRGAGVKLTNRDVKKAMEKDAAKAPTPTAQSKPANTTQNK